jgi:hypothetical protein
MEVAKSQLKKQLFCISLNAIIAVTGVRTKADLALKEQNLEILADSGDALYNGNRSTAYW